MKWTSNQLMDMPKRTKLSLLKQTTEGIGDVLFSHKLSFVWCLVGSIFILLFQNCVWFKGYTLAWVKLRVIQSEQIPNNGWKIELVKSMTGRITAQRDASLAWNCVLWAPWQTWACNRDLLSSVQPGFWQTRCFGTGSPADYLGFVFVQPTPRASLSNVSFRCKS